MHLAQQADFCMGLSATPIYNYGGEMHSVLDVLTRGEVGSRVEFMAEWGNGNEAIADPKAFGHYVREEGLMLRRTRAEVGREIPKVQQVVHKVDADLVALEEVSDRVAALARIILGKTAEAVKGERMRASEEISWRLRQATGVAKAPYVAEFVHMLAESEKKVVIFGWHKEVYSIWKDKLRYLNPAFFTGDETPAKKEESKKKFLLDPACRVMVLSLRAGQGLDGLQSVCRTVVFGELDWSPGVHEQCVGRIARDGQAQPVMAYYLVSDYGADPVMADVIEAKEQQVLGIRDPNATLIERAQVDPERIRKLAADYLTRHSGLLRIGHVVKPGDA
jgi:SNF2 family DNA or RNA helicase